MNAKELATILLNGEPTIQTAFGKMGEKALTYLLETGEVYDETSTFDSFKKERNLKFRTYHVVKNGKEVGRITVAKMDSEEDPNLREVAITFCSPKDKFNKVKGKIISVGRLLKGNKKVTMHKAENVREVIVATAQMKKIQWMKGIEPEDLK